MNEQLNQTSGHYPAEKIRRYGEHIAEQIRAVRDTFPTTLRIQVVSCHPLNPLYPGYEPHAPVPARTRTRAMQVALDNMAMHVTRRTSGVGFVDLTSVLGGFEHLAEDGRHYNSSGANSLVNVILNELFGA